MNKFDKFNSWLGLVIQTHKFDKHTIGFLRIAYRVGHAEGRRQEREKLKKTQAESSHANRKVSEYQDESE